MEDFEESKDNEAPKKQTIFSGASYAGPLSHSGNFSGVGVYTFPSGIIYEGEFLNGHFHGEGSMTIPGKGTYKSVWEQGREIPGRAMYVFKDGLPMTQSAQEWKYCTLEDRRFWREVEGGIPAAPLDISKAAAERRIPRGCYDAGDGYFDPQTNAVYDYPGSGNGAAHVVRRPSKEEAERIARTARLEGR